MSQTITPEAIITVFQSLPSDEQRSLLEKLIRASAPDAAINPPQPPQQSDLNWLEHYFDFHSADDIWLKGTRVGIEFILNLYLHEHVAPEEIVHHFSSITLEQVYATILYYFINTKAVSGYVDRWLAYCKVSEAAQDENPSPTVLRLKALLADTWISQKEHCLY
jgi:Protein of unknown function (DUF433)